MFHLIFGPGADPELVGDQLHDFRLVEENRLVKGGGAVLVEGEEFERVQPRIEAELDEREAEG